MATSTPLLGLVKPTVNGPDTENTWGYDINANFDKLDTAFAGMLIDNEAIDDRVAALLTPGANIAISYDDPSNKLVISSTSASTPEAIDDRVAGLLKPGVNIDIDYDDANNRIVISGSGIISLVDPGAGGTVFPSWAVAPEAAVDAAIKTFHTEGFWRPGDGGSGQYKRMLVAPGDPTRRCFIRTLDRFTSDGVTDATNGGYWQLVASGIGEVWLEQFGGQGDCPYPADPVSNPGATDNYIAFEHFKYFTTTVWYRATLRFGPGTFWTSDTWQVKGAQFSIKGPGPGRAGSATLRCPYNQSCIIVHTNNSWDEYGTAAGQGADGTEISGFSIWGTWRFVDHGHVPHVYGILLRAHGVVVNDVYILNVPQPFACIGNTFYQGQSYVGNANNCYFIRCQAYFSDYNGFLFLGSDANAGGCLYCDGSYASWYGFKDDSFLGNYHFGLHTSANGMYQHGAIPSADRASMVVHNNREWVALTNVPGADGGGHDWKTIEPGTDAAVWGRASTSIAAVASGNRPNWVDAIDCGPAGAYGGNNINSMGTWVACYAEEGQTVSQLAGAQMYFGGAMGGVLGSTGAYRGVWPILKTGSYAYADNLLSTIDIDVGGTLDRVFHFSTEDNVVYELGLDRIRGIWGLFDLWHTVANTTVHNGRSTAQPHVGGMRKLFLGDPATDYAREIYYDNGPAFQNHGVGDICLSIAGGNYVAGTLVPNVGAAAFQCITAGNPGTWKRWGPHMGSFIVTVDDPIFNQTQLWQNAAVAFTGVRFNFQDTGSAIGSLLLDLQKDGATKFQVGKEGGIGVFGHVAPTVRPTVTGSRGGNAALASLITALAGSGIIADGTSP